MRPPIIIRPVVTGPSVPYGRDCLLADRRLQEPVVFDEPTFFGELTDLRKAPASDAAAW